MQRTFSSGGIGIQHYRGEDLERGCGQTPSPCDSEWKCGVEISQSLFPRVVLLRLALAHATALHSSR